MGVEKIYNIAIIGYGSMALGHRDLFEEGNVRIKLKGVFDIDDSRMELAEKQGYIAYSSKEELLADPDVDIVLVSTTNDFHKALSIEALRAGKHVVCEKPVTLSAAELEEIISVSEKCGKIFTIDQNRRTNRDFINVWRNIDAGEIGKPYIIESRVEGSRGFPDGWRALKAKGGGMLLDWGVHLIDQIMYMVDKKVTNVFCKLYNINFHEVDDNFSLTLTFEDGPTAVIEVSTNSFIHHHRFHVFGTDGTMIVNNWDGTGKIVRKLYTDNEWDREIVKGKAGPTKTMTPHNPDSAIEIELKEPTNVVDSLQPVYEQLIDAIEGKTLKITPAQALRVMKVIDAAFESASNGMSVNTNI